MSFNKSLFNYPETIVCSISINKRSRWDGLGIRNLRLVNQEMSEKWRWRLLSGGSGLWMDILYARYSVTQVGLTWDGRNVCFRLATASLKGAGSLCKVATLMRILLMIGSRMGLLGSRWMGL
jgi:hypothetical protein